VSCAGVVTTGWFESPAQAKDERAELTGCSFSHNFGGDD
jgi:hypothetical protein